MEHSVDAVEQSVEVSRRQIILHELELAGALCPGQVVGLELAVVVVGERVHTTDLLAGVLQLHAQVGADEAGGAGDQVRAHFATCA